MTWKEIKVSLTLRILNACITNNKDNLSSKWFSLIHWDIPFNLTVSTTQLNNWRVWIQVETFYSNNCSSKVIKTFVINLEEPIVRIQLNKVPCPTPAFLTPPPPPTTTTNTPEKYLEKDLQIVQFLFRIYLVFNWSWLFINSCSNVSCGI